MVLILGVDRVVLIMTSQNKSSMQMKSLAQPTIDNASQSATTLMPIGIHDKI